MLTSVEFYLYRTFILLLCTSIKTSIIMILRSCYAYNMHSIRLFKKKNFFNVIIPTCMIRVLDIIPIPTFNVFYTSDTEQKSV